MAFDPIAGLEALGGSTRRGGRSSGGTNWAKVFAEALGGGSSTTERARAKRSAKAFSPSSASAGGLAPKGKLSEITKRALKGEKGPKSARAAYRKLMDSDISDDAKKQVKKFYDTGEGGPKGDDSLWSQLTHNPLTDLVGQGLMLIDKPKRAVLASIDEAVQAISGEEVDKGSSWVDKVLRDKSYGGGDLMRHLAEVDKRSGTEIPGVSDVLTSKWGQRAAGLLADVAGDPLTYLSGGTTAIAKGGVKGAGTTGRALKLGREEVSQRLMQAGLGETGAKVARRGASAATKSELAEAGLQGGLKFAGRSIPHTSALNRAPGLALGPVKEFAFGSRAAGVFGDDVLGEFRKVVRDKKSAPDKVWGAQVGIRKYKGTKSVTNHMAHESEAKLNELLGQAKRAKVDGKVIRAAMTGEMGGAEILDGLMPNGTAKFKNWIEDLRGTANKLGADETGEEWLQHVDDYFPRQLNKETRIRLSKGSEKVKGGTTASMDIRRLKAGDDLLGYELGSEDVIAQFGDTVDNQVNGILKENAGLEGEWFNDDAFAVLPQYLEGVKRKTHEKAFVSEMRKAGVVDHNVAAGQVDALKAGSEAALDQADVMVPDALSKAAAAQDEAGMAYGAAGDAASTAQGAQSELEAAIAAIKQGPGPSALPESPLSPPSKPGALAGLESTPTPTVPSEDATARLRASFGDELPDPAIVSSNVDKMGKNLEGLQGQLARAKSPRHAAEIQQNIDVVSRRLEESKQMLDDLAATGVPVPPSAVPEVQPEEVFDQIRSSADNPEVIEQRVDTSIQQIDAKLSAFDKRVGQSQVPNDDVRGATAELQVAKQELTEAKAFARQAARTSDKALSQVAGLRATAAELKAKSVLLGEQAVNTEAALAAIRSGKGSKAFTDMLDDGMQSLGRDAIKLLDTPKWVLDALEQTAFISQDPSKFFRFIDTVNRIFKTQAILSPGFHVRNSMGAFFMNFVAGADTTSYGQFTRAMGQFRRKGIEGVAEKWRPRMQELYDAGILDAGNRVSAEMALGLTGRGGRLRVGQQGINLPGDGTLTRLRKTTGGRISPTDNPVTRLSAAAGSRVENYHRGALAWDTLRKGGSIDEAIEKVSHFHFDYDDLSRIEKEGFRRVIPFWTWTSRNLPLQIEQLARNPKMYQRYNVLKDTFQTDEKGDGLTPSYIKDSITAIGLGGDNFVTPNLPFENVDELLTKGDNPLEAGLLNAAPIVKTPLEMAFGKQIFSGAPLSDKLQPVPGAWQSIPGLMPLLDAGGFVKKTRGGKYLISENKAYGVEQALPIMGRFRRMFPSKEDASGKYYERHDAAILSFFGLGTKHVTEKDKSNEAYRRWEALREAGARVEEEGYVLGDLTPKAKHPRSKAQKDKAARIRKAKEAGTVKRYELVD